MRAVIIDDNDRARIALKSDLEDYCPQVDIVGEADGVSTGLRVITRKSPDVVFLDIKMGDGTGFDLLEQLDTELNFKLIFTTAYDEFALKAFKYSAMDYLLKPIDSSDLVTTVKKVQGGIRENTDDYSEMFKVLKGSKPSKLTLPESDRIHIVNISSIIRCEADKNYTTFLMEGGEKITVSRTLKEYDELLNTQGFIRVHHSHLVNLTKIKELVKVDGPYLVMSNNDQVPVSSRKKDGLLNRLKDFF